jgi:nucleotide-binding universal stress UspA family protein
MAGEPPPVKARDFTSNQRPGEIHLGVRESIGDTAPVLSRYVHAIEARLLHRRDLELLADATTVPVINGLTDLDHPVRTMSDALTILERFGSFEGIHVVFSGRRDERMQLTRSHGDRAGDADDGREPSAAPVLPECTDARCGGLSDTQRMIVVGIDGSKGSEAALQFASAEAELRDVPLRVVSAWYVPTVDSVDYASWQRETAERQLNDLLGADRAAATELVVTEGSPAAVLRDESESAELLVVGSRGHGGFAGLLLGSVSQQCAAHAHCPVVIVHSE